jgi:hypothetical protein
MKILIILVLVGLCNCVPTPDTDYFDSVPQENLPADQPDNSDIENLSSDQPDIENLSSDESDFYDETPQENLSDDSKDSDLDREPSDSDFEIPAGSKLVKEDSLPLTSDSVDENSADSFNLDEELLDEPADDLVMSDDLHRDEISTRRIISSV